MSTGHWRVAMTGARSEVKKIDMNNFKKLLILLYQFSSPFVQLVYIIKERMSLNKMLRLSEKLHEELIRQAVPNITDKEVSRVIRYWPSANPFHYPEWFDDIWSTTSDRNCKEINKACEVCVTRTINCVDPIRAVVIYHLGVFNLSSDLISSEVTKCIDKHRHLVMRMGYERKRGVRDMINLKKLLIISLNM